MPKFSWLEALQFQFPLIRVGVQCGIQLLPILVGKKPVENLHR